MARRGNVEDAAQRHRVVRVRHSAQVGERVPDLPPLVEPDAADDLVGQPDPDEHLFQDPGLRVGAVEHRHVARLGQGFVAEPVDLLRDELGLIVLVVGDVADDLRAIAAVGPQPLRLAVGVAGDDGVRRGQDGLRRPVVLLEQDHPGVGVVGLELQDVADRRAAEGVDRLVGVTDDTELGRRKLGVDDAGPTRSPSTVRRCLVPTSSRTSTY